MVSEYYWREKYFEIMTKRRGEIIKKMRGFEEKYLHPIRPSLKLEISEDQGYIKLYDPTLNETMPKAHERIFVQNFNQKTNLSKIINISETIEKDTCSVLNKIHPEFMPSKNKISINEYENPDNIDTFLQGSLSNDEIFVKENKLNEDVQQKIKSSLKFQKNKSTVLNDTASTNLIKPPAKKDINNIKTSLKHRKNMNLQGIPSPIIKVSDNNYNILPLQIHKENNNLHPETYKETNINNRSFENDEYNFDDVPFKKIIKKRIISKNHHTNEKTIIKDIELVTTYEGVNDQVHEIKNFIKNKTSFN